MVDAALNPEVREAIDELQMYLSDTLPPLVVADSIKLLLDYPVSLVASNIHAWTAAQYRGGADVPVSDYLFHAVKKIQLMGEFHLVPQEPFQKYLANLKIEVLNYCPEGDREFLKDNLARLGDASTSLSSSIDVLFRQATPRERPLASGTVSAGAGGGGGGGGGAAPDLAGLRRVEMLLDRLEREVQRSTDPQASLKKAPLASQTLAAAARSSQNARELDQVLDRLRSLGLDVGTQDVLRSLGNSLPGWIQPVTGAATEGAEPVAPSPTVEAMRRVVTGTEDPAEGARRFNEMVKTAIERFNEGSLGQAITMLELAERIIAERQVDPVAADLVRRKADDGIDVERLRKYAEAVEQHPNLRRVLNFFTSLTPDGLFASLRKEPKRERRRLLLLLLEVHGLAARQSALERLHVVFGQGAGDEDWYFRRNLLYLLRRLPRPPGTGLEEDVDVAARHAELRFPAPLVKEAMANLGQLKHERAERTLVGILHDLEGMLTKPGESPYDPREMRLLLDRLVAALARYGTPGARRAVVEHGLSGKKEFGDTMSRLAELAGQDLSAEQDLVDKLLETLRANTPFKLFGLVLHQNDRNLYHCIEALSTTPSPEVAQAFREIVRRFPGQDVAKLAEKALAAFAAGAAAQAATAPEAVASLSGDLEVFGLPALMQSLAESGHSGSLTLREPKGEMFGSLALRAGKLSKCQTGRLTGEEAFYQLLERPRPGSFLFVRKDEAPSDTNRGMNREVLPLTLEGMRRYDEFQQSAALVPDEVSLKATDIRPTPHPDERDGALVKDLWTSIASSATPRQCETELKADSYRIRRMLAHWVEQGALTIAETPVAASS
jgi:uncharacterized protein DUF4388